MAQSLRYPIGISTLFVITAMILSIYVTVPVTHVAATRLSDIAAEQVIGAASNTTEFLAGALAVVSVVTIIAAIIPSPVQPVAWAILGSSWGGVATAGITGLGAACLAWGPCE